MSVTPIEVPPVWGNYVDLVNDAKPYLQLPATSTTYDVQLQLIVDMSCTWVQDYLGRPVAETEFFRRFSGTNSSVISLPYYPVTQVISVVEYWGTSGPHTLTEQTPANQGGQDTYSLDRMRGAIIRSFLGLVQRPVFPGLRNVEVTWRAGYNPVPPTIRVATLELINYWWRNTQEAPRTSALTANGYEEPTSTALWPAVPQRVTMLLEPFVQVGIG